MNAAVQKLKPDAEVIAPAAHPLAKLREPFPDNQISKLPKETKKQADDRKAAQDKGNWPAKCKVCEGYHHPNAVHLDYVGHAALTDRLLDVDPHWSWEPVAMAQNGLPAFDGAGGLWIKLTICGVTRLGYGHAGEKKGGDAVKEIIGDALRNAAMRFGAALDLWHKGDLHAHEESEGDAASAAAVTAEIMAIQLLRSYADNKVAFKEAFEKNKAGWREVMDDASYGRVVAEMKALAANFTAPPSPPPPPPPKPSAFDISEDEIPY